MRPVTLITGASAGIGVALARVFARNGHQLVLVARRTSKLDALAAEIAGSGQPRPLVIPLDLGRNDAARTIGNVLTAQGMEPQYVVNNAGFGLIGLAATLRLDEQLAMIDVNVRSLADLSLAFVDSLARHRGGLLNVASIAGFVPGPGMAVYYATKAYVLSFSEALHRELAPRGVRVTALCPGPVPTEFAARAGSNLEVSPRLFWTTADQVAKAGYRGLMRGRRIIIPGILNKLMTPLLRFVPRNFLLNTINKRQVARGRSAASS